MRGLGLFLLGFTIFYAGAVLFPVTQPVKIASVILMLVGAIVAIF